QPRMFELLCSCQLREHIGRGIDPERTFSAVDCDRTRGPNPLLVAFRTPDRRKIESSSKDGAVRRCAALELNHAVEAKPSNLFDKRWSQFVADQYLSVGKGFLLQSGGLALLDHVCQCESLHLAQICGASAKIRIFGFLLIHNVTR